MVGNVSENFELRFNHHCIKANYRDLAKNPVCRKSARYKSPLLEISALYPANSNSRRRLKKKTFGLDG